jgi:hypothetical protein
MILREVASGHGAAFLADYPILMVVTHSSRILMVVE